MKLNQILAVEKQYTSRANETLTLAQNVMKRDSALTGISRTYRPHQDGGEQLPAEYTRVQVNMA